MVEEQLRSRGIRDRRVLQAMANVPREDFLPPRIRSAAYEDRALPVEHGQTVSQPYIVAYMTEKLETSPDRRVLEIGTGMGYQTAILAMLSRQVYTVERIAALQELAVINLRAYPNISFVVGDGSLGLPDHAPYDRIIVTAAAPSVPPALVDQLDDEGVLIVPVGGAAEQTIVRVVREGGRTRETAMLACRFVKLVGRAAWPNGT
jgi:protein-L-isoaspartate(D-aspartate) O-methyltransferase